MIPAELPCTLLKFVLPREPKILVITGADLRHERFALRLQREFGTKVVAWYSVNSHPPTLRHTDKYRRLVRAVLTTMRDPRRLIGLSGEFWQWWRGRSRPAPSQSAVEERLFGEEVLELRETAHLAPRKVTDLNSSSIVDEIRSLEPTFTATLGGPIYSTELITCASAFALNQHDGWCPEYKGASSVFWTLYRRELGLLGSTVHLLTSGMDAGPILRRSTACITDKESLESCFARSVALGTELVCEVIQEALQKGELECYEQPDHQGYTFLKSQLTPSIRKLVEEDLSRGFLEAELARVRNF